MTDAQIQDLVRRLRNEWHGLTGQQAADALEALQKDMQLEFNVHTRTIEEAHNNYRRIRCDGERAGLEKAVRICQAKRDSMAVSCKKAADAGRESVASHRQSDVETCSALMLEILSLIPQEQSDVKCPECKGDGWNRLSDSVLCGPCRNCNGTGQIVVWGNKVVSWVCPNCSGTGKQKDQSDGDKV